MTPIVLASASTARAHILASAAVPFTVTKSGVDEDAVKVELAELGASPMLVASQLAELKALAVSRVTAGLIIGADQTLELDGQCHDKTGNLAQTRARLVALRGRAHQLHAAVCVAAGGKVIWRCQETATLWVRSFSDAYLEDYMIKWGELVASSVGAYHYEGAGAQLFDRVDGDYFTILGLPLLPLLAFLREHGALRQ